MLHSKKLSVMWPTEGTYAQYTNAHIVVFFSFSIFVFVFHLRSKQKHKNKSYENKLDWKQNVDYIMQY